MKTSISSKGFCSITDRQTDKIFTEQMLIYEGNLHKKMERHLNQGPRKSRFPLNVVDGQTDGHLLLQSSFATTNKDNHMVDSIANVTIIIRDSQKILIRFKQCKYKLFFFAILTQLSDKKYLDSLYFSTEKNCAKFYKKILVLFEYWEDPVQKLKYYPNSEVDPPPLLHSSQMDFLKIVLVEGSSLAGPHH